MVISSALWGKMFPDVSCETREALETYHKLLLQWQKTVNLVSPSTIDHAWLRHFQDSYQLIELAPTHKEKWLDLGSGAGFPGLVVAIVSGRWKVTLVESDKRKCGFLREVARRTDVQVEIIADRIESIPLQSADVISARALAPLKDLVQLAQLHMSENTTLLFPKGANVETEIADLPQEWQDRIELIQSKTDQRAKIVRISPPIQN